jgi:hypothetical protein
MKKNPNAITVLLPKGFKKAYAKHCKGLNTTIKNHLKTLIGSQIGLELPAPVKRTATKKKKKA